MNNPLSEWHDLLQTGATEKLDTILADDVTFHSPVVHTPQEGKKITSLYLGAAAHVLANDSFTYVREVIGENDAILEFTTELEGIAVNGVDMIHWNQDGLIDDFKVMIRPLKAVNKVHAMMGQMLQAMSK